MKSSLAVLLFVALIFANSALAREIHSKHFFAGMPTGEPESSDLIFRDLYVLSNNDETKFANWVAYKLTPQETFGDLDLDRAWKTDHLLEESETLEFESDDEDEYKGSYAAFGYDRGHLAPLASFKGSKYASQVNFYSNIVPQKKGLNRGPWMRLEAAVRDLVAKHQEVWVITGPYYDPNLDMPELIGSDEPHQVPSGFWKIVCVWENGAPIISSFMMSQELKQSDDFEDFAVSIDQIEAVTGLDFLWELPNELEEKIEAISSSLLLE